jgi:hypothetical protein
VLQARQRAQDLLENRESAVDIATAQAELAQISAQVALLQKIKKSAGQVISPGDSRYPARTAAPVGALLDSR